MSTLLRRLWHWVRRSRLEADLAEEMEFHREMTERELARNGHPPDDVRPAAHRALGSMTLARERSREVWVWPWLESLLYDLRFALHGLRRTWMFSAAAIAMLTLGIGLNTTVFTVMSAFLSRGYPLVKDNDRVVYLQERFPGGRCCISYPDFEAWRAQARAFQGMAFVGERFISLRDGDGRSMDASVFTVSPNLFGLLGVRPMLGRDFRPEDEFAGAPQVAILNYRFWERRFGKRVDVVGAAIQINGAAATIIGVMPERFDFPTQFDLWMPLVQSPELQQRGVSQGFIAAARLRDGISREDARVELETINKRLAEDYPATNRGVVLSVSGHAEMVSGSDAPLIWRSLWVGAWFVLLIACANLANLSLVRTMARWRDLSTRIALGAGQWRIVRQIALESLILTGAAGTIAWWVTQWSVGRWAIATASVYQILDYTVDGGTLAYLLAISLATATLWAGAPILRIWQLGAGAGLKGDAHGVTQGLRGKHFARVLVAVQMALAIVLLAGAGVLVRSFVNIDGAKTGIREPEHILVGRLTLPSEKYSSLPKRLAYFDRLETELRSISGVRDMSVSNGVPIRGGPMRPIEVEGHPMSSDDARSAVFLTVGSGYFRMMVPVMAGRDFNDSDVMSTSKVVIVNDRFASLFWPGEQPIGKRLRSVDSKGPGEWHTVVGVVPNNVQRDPLRQGFTPVVYVAAKQYPMRVAYFFVRTTAPPDAFADVVRTYVQRVDPDVMPEEFATLKARLRFERDFMDAQYSELGKHASIAPVFAVIALVLAVFGLAAVVAYSVTQRTKEIGVRMAIGADSSDVRALVLREGMTPVVIGMFLGLIGSLGVNRVLQSQLVGVSPYDPVTMIGAPFVLIVVALVACQLPARRAVNVDPVIALRHD